MDVLVSSKCDEYPFSKTTVCVEISLKVLSLILAM